MRNILFAGICLAAVASPAHAQLEPPGKISKAAPATIGGLNVVVWKAASGTLDLPPSETYQYRLRVKTPIFRWEQSTVAGEEHTDFCPAGFNNSCLLAVTSTAYYAGATMQSQARAVNSAGPGEWSDIGELEVSGNAAAAPGAPVNVTATAGSGAITLTWSPPSTGNATDYRVRWQIADAGGGQPGAWQGWVSATNGDISVGGNDDGINLRTLRRTSAFTTTTHTISGLIDGTAYNVAVAAVNQISLSAFTAAANSITPVAASSDSTLSDLVVEGGDNDSGDGMNLLNNFAASTLTYNLGAFDSSVLRLFISADVADSNASVTHWTLNELMHNLSSNNDGEFSADISGITDASAANTLVITVAAEDTTTTDYTLLFTRAGLSAVKTLSDLAVSDGALMPGFQSGIQNYTVSVPYSASTFTVTPMVTDTGKATLKVDDITLDDGASRSITLSVGENTINIEVTAEDGVKQTYQIVVTREQSDIATLESLVLSEGMLSPTFMTNTFRYTATVPFPVQSITITPTVTDSAPALVRVHGATVDSGTASRELTLTPGENTFETIIVAQNGNSHVYTIIITRMPASTIATLSNLEISAGALNTAFDSGRRVYSAGVAFETTTVTLTPTLSDTGKAAVTVNGASVNDGEASDAISLEVGANEIQVVVTAEDGSTTQTYTLNMTRADSTDATLSALALSPGMLAETFAPGTREYTAAVTFAVENIKVTPTVADTLRMATVTVNNAAVNSGGESGDIALTTGVNEISIVVTAAAGNTLTYTLRVTRAAASGVNTLDGLSISAGTLSTVFNSATLAYTAEVNFSVAEIRVTPTLTDADFSTVTVAGAAAANASASDAVQLNPGAAVDILVVITAQSGATKTYTISVTRGASNIATLKSLTLSQGSLDPVFDADTFVYAAAVSAATADVMVTPTVTETGLATVAVKGSAVASGSASAAITLSTGENAIEIIVTAQDGATTRTYTVNLTRNANNDAQLSALTISASGAQIMFAESFAPGTQNYTASVAFETAAVSVTATAGLRAQLQIDGGDASSGVASDPIALEIGANTIIVNVTAEDDSMLNYEIIITRAQSNIATLTGIGVAGANAVEIAPDFAEDILTYTASVAFATAAVTVTPVLADSRASVTVNGGDATLPVQLNIIGENEIIIAVTAQNGNDMREYKLNITRRESNVATLEKLEIPGVNFDPNFDAETFAYTASVKFAVTAVSVITAVTDTGKASAGINGAALTDDIASDPISLQVSETEISITVTAADGSEQIYTITVTRGEASAENALTSLSISAGTLTPDFMADTFTYAARVGFDTAGITITAAADETAAIDINGNDPSEVVALTAGGVTEIIITVTAENGDAQTYTINITREVDPSLRKATDVNADGVNDSVDGLLIMRYLLGLRDLSLAIGVIDANLVEINAIEKRIAAEVDAKSFNINGDDDVTAADGEIISRYLSGITSGDELLNGQSNLSAAEVAQKIETLLNQPAVNVIVDARLALDVNSDAASDAADGVLIAQHLLGIKGRAEIARRIAAEVSALNFDVDADTETNAADGILIARYLLGVTEGDGLTMHQTSAAAADVIAKIEGLKAAAGLEQ